MCALRVHFNSLKKKKKATTRKRSNQSVKSFSLLLGNSGPTPCLQQFYCVTQPGWPCHIPSPHYRCVPDQPFLPNRPAHSNTDACDGAKTQAATEGVKHPCFPEVPRLFRLLPGEKSFLLLAQLCDPVHQAHSWFILKVVLFSFRKLCLLNNPGYCMPGALVCNSGLLLFETTVLFVISINVKINILIFFYTMSISVNQSIIIRHNCLYIDETCKVPRARHR